MGTVGSNKNLFTKMCLLGNVANGQFRNFMINVSYLSCISAMMEMDMVWTIAMVSWIYTYFIIKTLKTLYFKHVQFIMSSTPQ